MSRDGFPWYRKDKRCWYVWRGERQARLTTDKKETFSLWHEIHFAPRPPAEEVGEGVADLVDRYLAGAPGG